MALGDDQGVEGRHGIGIPDRECEGVLSDDPLGGNVAEHAITFRLARPDRGECVLFWSWRLRIAAPQRI